MDPVRDPAKQLEEKLNAMRQEELFEKANPEYASSHPRYLGICGSLGNAVFSNTPIAPPCKTKDPRPSGNLPGYNMRVSQHPMYTTSSSAYGCIVPTKASFPIKHFAKDQSFTKVQKIGGNYEDCHLTTEKDKSFHGL